MSPNTITMPGGAFSVERPPKTPPLSYAPPFRHTYSDRAKFDGKRQGTGFGGKRKPVKARRI